MNLKGISTGDLSEALEVLVGEDAKGLSPNVVSRLKVQWADEHTRWNERDLTQARYVYWWADGIHPGLRAEESSDGQCLLVIIGVTPDDRKERVAIGDGFRESKEPRKELLLDLKAKGLPHGPLLAVGDGAMGLGGERSSRNAPSTLLVPQDGQRTDRAAQTPARARNTGPAGNLDGGEGHRSQHRIRSLPDGVCAEIPQGGGKLIKDRDALRVFYDFPAEHWAHIRTTNPIEFTFATGRHRATRTKNCVSRATFLGLVFYLTEEAQKSCRRIRGADKIELLLKGIPFKDGAAVQDNPTPQQNLAA